MPFFSLFFQILQLHFKICIALLHFKLHFKICIALLHKNPVALLQSNQFIKVCLLSAPSSKFYRCVSRSVLHCCMRKDSCLRKKLSFFGGRMLMCENQCCVVASAFSAFSHLFSKNFIYAFENQCCVVASPLFSFFPQNFIGAFQDLCCIVA